MILFVNDLTVIDFSYLCAERGIVGESWIVDVLLDGDLNDESMILDFGLVKKNIKRLIDEDVDHKLLVPTKNNSTRIEDVEENVCVDFERSGDKSIYLNCPKEAYAFLDAANIDMKSVTEYLQRVIEGKLPGNVQGIEVVLRAENINTPYYHYSHGLKKHDGNCQRIAHGHRSKFSLKWMGCVMHFWSNSGASAGKIYIC